MQYTNSEMNDSVMYKFYWWKTINKILKEEKAT